MLNEFINKKYSYKNSKFFVLKLNTISRYAQTFLENKHYNQLHHDNLHFNYLTGLYTLRNSGPIENIEWAHRRIKEVNKIEAKSIIFNPRLLFVV